MIMLLCSALVQTQLTSNVLAWEAMPAQSNGSRTFLKSWEGFTDHTDFCVAMQSLIQLVNVSANRLCTFCQGSRKVPERKSLDLMISILLYFT